MSYEGVRMKNIIKTLVETTSPSGYEDAIQKVVSELIAPLKGEKDALGNLVVRKGKMTEKGLRVMLAAHVDEIGVIAKHIDEKGFIRFSTLGGVRPQTLLGGRVKFMSGVQGIIGGEKLESLDKLHSFERLYIDVGAKDRQSCPVRVGDVAGFDRPFLDLGERLVAKSMDDRIGAAVLIEVLKQVKSTPNELVFVFSTQEEVGMRGAMPAAFAIDPGLGISVDVTLSGDTPKGEKMAVELGKGPAIKVRDAGMLSDVRVVRWMVDAARKAGIPYQLEVLEGGTTDARAMQVSRGGMPAGCVSIPCRYVHSPSEMVDFEDVRNAVKLLSALVSNPIELK
jgi:putative aminopeptidase FrvX